MPKISLEALLTINNFGGQLAAVGSWGLTFEFASERVAEEVFDKFDGWQPGYHLTWHHNQIDFYISLVVKCEGGSHI